MSKVGTLTVGTSSTADPIFALVAAPMRGPWGTKAFSGYLGEDRTVWQDHDATELVGRGLRAPPLLIDQGLDDEFLGTQLHVDAFEAACRTANQPLTLRRHAGYDHSYYFIASFVADHIARHAAMLGAL